MIEFKVPKDIRVYETKVFGPLTLRQTLCVLGMIVFDLTVYFGVLKPLHLKVELAIYLFLIPNVLIGLFGWMKPNGVPFEKWLKGFLINTFIAPTRRKVSNVIVKMEAPKISKKEAKKAEKNLKKEVKNHPEWKAYK